MTTDTAAALADRLDGIPVLRDEDDTAPYCRDWHGDHQSGTQAVLRPATTEEVVRCVRVCAELGLGIVPSGGRTGLVEGHLPSDPATQVVLSLDRMNRIRELDPDNYVAHVDAGCILQSVREAAAEHDLAFPLALAAQGSCQIGGCISANAGGLNVLRHGMTRDLVLGLEVVLADGTVWNGLSSLRKDNRGVDPTHLVIGAEGRLGIVTGASLKLIPAQTRKQTALLAVPSLDLCLQLYRLARRQCSDLLSAFEVLPANACEIARIAQPDLPSPVNVPDGVLALVEISSSGYVDPEDLMSRLVEEAFGASLVTNGTIAASEAQAHGIWAIREGLNEGQAAMGAHVRSDLSVPLSRMAELVAALDDRLARSLPRCRGIWYGHVGDGNIHYNIHPPKGEGLDTETSAAAYDLLHAAVAEAGGSISAEHGIGRRRREAYHASAEPGRIEIQDRLRRALDPVGLLNPMA